MQTNWPKPRRQNSRNGARESRKVFSGLPVPKPDGFRVAAFERRLAAYRKLTRGALLKCLPARGPRYLYDLVSVYTGRGGKGLRSAFLLAACEAFGGDSVRALNSAVALELFHNGFLIHDDVQDDSQFRRGQPTLHNKYGVGIAVNVGNATNLIAMGQLMRNRVILGPSLSWSIALEMQEMLRHSLEGQALELCYIHENAFNLNDEHYYHICLKKTSWYTCINPLRVGALIARQDESTLRRLSHFGWLLGVAFQIQDDVLNLVGNYRRYGKEIAGDLLEGKRTLILIHALRHCTRADRTRIKGFLEKPRGERLASEIRWLRQLLIDCGSVQYAQNRARQLSGAALSWGISALKNVEDSPAQKFLLQAPLYVVNRKR